MSLVLNEYTGDGVTTTFNFAMVGGYLSRNFVVFLTRPNDKLLEYSPYTGTVTWLSDFSVRVSDPIPVGTTFVITRRTDAAALVDFQNTSRITERNLDTAFRQSLHRTAELEDVTARRAEASTRLAEDALTAAKDATESSATAASLVASANAAAATSAEFAREAARHAEAATDTADGALALIQQAVKGNVDSFNGRDGAVSPERGDYTPDMVGFDIAGVLTPSAASSAVPAWSDPVLNAQAQALANRSELLRDNQKRTPMVYATLTEASAAAATLPDGQVVEVRSDNNRSALSTRYTVNSEGSIEFAGYAFPSHLSEYDGESLHKIADYGKALPSYTELRAYKGRALAVRVTEKNTTGFFNLDASDTTTIDDGGTCIVDAVGRRWKRADPGIVRAEYFGMVGDYYLSDGTPNPTPTDNAQAFQRLMAFMNQPSMKARAVLFSAGGFYTSVPLIISFPNRYIYGSGRNATRFIFGNSGVCVQFNNGNPNHGVFSFGGGMRGVGIRGNANTSILLDIDGLNHCRFDDIDVAEASPATGKAYRIGGVVCGHFEDIVYSSNATIMSSPSYNGLSIELNYAGTVRPTGNTFVNVIIEGATGDGCVLTDAENSTFIGGTIENNAGNNINVGATCRTNTWIGTAFESRVTSYADVYDAGQMTKLINCYTSRWVRTAASSFQFSMSGGVHGSIELLGQYGDLENIQYAFFGPGTFLVHPTTTTKNVFNKALGVLEFHKVAAFSVPFSGNPTTWTNDKGRPVQVMVAGSGLVFYVRDGIAIGSGNIGSPVTVLPGDALRIQASSGTPVISAIPL